MGHQVGPLAALIRPAAGPHLEREYYNHLHKHTGGVQLSYLMILASWMGFEVIILCYKDIEVYRRV